MTKEEIIFALERAIIQIRHGDDEIVTQQSIALAFEAIKNYISEEPVKKPKRPGAQKPKDWEELWQYVHVELGMTNDDCRYLWNNWKANNFTRNGQPILDWKAAARAWKAGRFYPSQKVAK